MNQSIPYFRGQVILRTNGGFGIVTKLEPLTVLAVNTDGTLVDANPVAETVESFISLNKLLSNLFLQACAETANHAKDIILQNEKDGVK